MKKIIILSSSVLMMFLLTISGYAQQRQGGQQRGGNMDPKEFANRQTEMMKKELELTAVQVPKVEALNLKYAEKMKAARDASTGDRDAMRSKMRAMMQEKDVELKKILTPEQWTKLEEWRKEARENNQRRRGI